MLSRIIMTKYLGSAFVIACGILTLCEAAEPEVPEPFKGFDNASKYAINYDDLTDLLNAVVFDAGPSDRQIAQPAADITGTRMKDKIKKTANEGNRFFYETFKENEKGQQFLRNIHTSLLQVPEEIPLENFSRNEQLAYWLNLYNVTVLNEIVAVYPKRSLENLIRGENSILSRKLLMVAGVSLSLDDIQFTILKQNYDNNPLIFYGLYQGIVGGPNIRTSAYTGDDVYLALEDNAYEFINSNRGTFPYDESVFRVSSLYDRNRTYFQEFEADLSQHLLQFLEGRQRTRLQTASTLQPDINDWTVTDMGGTRHDNIGASLANNHAAMLGSYTGPRRANGGITVAAVIVKPKREEPKKEETVTIEDLGRVPGEKRGASVEEITVGEIEPID
jgi:hypothetical protein